MISLGLALMTAAISSRAISSFSFAFLTDGVQARRIAVPVPHAVRHCRYRRLAHFSCGGVVRVYLHIVSSLVLMTTEYIITIYAYCVNRQI